MSKESTNEILADRLNTEPVVFRGLSNSELGLVFKVSVLFWVPTCVLVAYFFGAPMMGLAAALVLILGTITASGNFLQIIKRGRPDYYYQHRMALRNKINTRSETYIQYTGDWELGRIEDKAEIFRKPSEEK